MTAIPAVTSTILDAAGEQTSDNRAHMARLSVEAVERGAAGIASPSPWLAMATSEPLAR